MSENCRLVQHEKQPPPIGVAAASGITVTVKTKVHNAKKRKPLSGAFALILDDERPARDGHPRLFARVSFDRERQLSIRLQQLQLAGVSPFAGKTRHTFRRFQHFSAQPQSFETSYQEPPR